MKKFLVFLALLFAAPAFAQTAGQFVTVADIPALGALTSRPPVVYLVAGKLANDSQGGMFNWVPNSTEAVDHYDVVQPSAGGPAGRWIRQRAFTRDFFVEQFNPLRTFDVNDPNADDSIAVIKALQLAAALGGGTVVFGPHAYWLKQTITVPVGVSVRCAGYAGRFYTETLIDFRNRKCSVYLAPGKTIALGGEWREVNVFADLVHFTTPESATAPTASRAAMRTYVDSFNGTGFTLTLRNAVIRQIAIGGFNECIHMDGPEQIIFEDILMDCRNGLYIDNSYDDNRLRNVQLWEFLTAWRAQNNDRWNIKSIAAGPGGVIRLVLNPFDTSTAATPETPLVVGTTEKLWVNAPYGVGGGEGAGGLWDMQVISAVGSDFTVDLVGSKYAPTTTGSPTKDSLYIPVASTDSLQPGMTVAGTGIPAGAKIGAVWWTRKAISLEQGWAATASGTNVSLTFANNAYTANTKQVLFNGNYRDGIGFHFRSADGSTCEGCFAFGMKIGFKFEGSVGMSLVNLQVDNTSSVPNMNAENIGLWFATRPVEGSRPVGVSYSNYVQGSMITAGQAVVSTSDFAGSPNVVTGFRFASHNAKQVAAEISRGSTSLIGNGDTASKVILIDEAAPNPIMIGNDLLGTLVYGTGTQPAWEEQKFGGQSGYRFPLQIGAAMVQVNSFLQPTINFNQTSSGVDSKIWRLWTSSTDDQFCLQTVNDAYTASDATWCATRVGTTAQEFQVLSSIFQAPNLHLLRTTTYGAAPGATRGRLELVCGTNPGTAKLQITSGTSNTPITITNNIGAGVSGC